MQGCHISTGRWQTFFFIRTRWQTYRSIHTKAPKRSREVELQKHKDSIEPPKGEKGE